MSELQELAEDWNTSMTRRVKKEKEDVVNHPKHYQMAGGLEVIDFIIGATAGLDGKDGYFVGNILKYVCRYSKKNGLEDLKKAQWYLNKLIESKEEE